MVVTYMMMWISIFLSWHYGFVMANDRKLAIKEGQLASFGVRVPEESEYPTTCPFSIEQILDEDFYGV